LSRDGLTIYFLRVEPTYLWKLWQAERNSIKEPLGNVRELSELYVGKHLHNAWVSADGLRLYYSRHENPTTKTVIRLAERPNVTAPWTDIMAFSDIHNNYSYDYLASLTGDELTMFYTRRGGGGGGVDNLYRATRSSINEQFSHRVAVGELNYDGHTLGPCVMPDGLAIYFSDMRDGRETNDIYVARRTSTNGLFDNIELLGMSTEQFTEQWVHVMPDEKTMYYYSSRGEEGAGIWVTHWQESEPIELEMRGVNELGENLSTSYTAIVHYEEGSTRNVTHKTVWTVQPENVATISAGLLQAGDVDQHQRITIKAQYTEKDTIVEIEKEVLVYAICSGGSALQFDGIDDYVEINGYKGITGTNSRTVTAWVKTDINDKYADIISWGSTDNGGRWLLTINPDGALKMAVYGNTVGTTDVTDGKWHYVAAVFENDGTPNVTDVKLYVDGVKDPISSSVSQTINTGNIENVKIGAFTDSDSRYFDGLIDNVQIWEVALTQEQIYANMHQRLTGTEPDLAAYWNMDEEEGQIVYDLSPSGNHGSLGSDPDNPDGSDPEWVVSDAPVGICYNVAVDIKPGSCPNPLNLASKGMLPVAVLGREDFEVSEIDPVSIRLVGVAAIRSSIEDVAQPVSDANECACSTEGPDGYEDLVLKFEAQEIAAELMRTSGELVKGGVYILPLSGTLFDGTAITGEDCVKLVGNVPKWIGASLSDINGDGVVNILDFSMMTQYWLEGW
jgi:hypothetical protein